MEYLYDEQKRQACLWYMFVDICVFDRTDHVDYPETRVRNYDFDIVERKLKEALDAGYDSLEDDKFNWLMEYGRSTGDRKTDVNRRRLNFKQEQRKAKRLRWDQRNLYKQTVEWQSLERERRQAIKRKWISLHWDDQQTMAIQPPSKVHLRPADDHLEKSGD